MSIIGSANGPTTIYLSGLIGDFFIIPSFLILIIFYGIYFIKLLSQKRNGIQTRQLGRRTEKNIRITEISISVISVLIVAIELYCILYNWNLMPTLGRIIGIFIGLTGDSLFFIAVLTMKKSWRAGIPENDKTEFVSRGIYKYSRNPAFLGFDLMYIGILMMYFNILLLIFTILAIIIFHLQIIQEENYLQSVFGNEYLEYKKHTHRYWGKINN